MIHTIPEVGARHELLTAQSAPQHVVSGGRRRLMVLCRCDCGVEFHIERAKWGEYKSCRHCNPQIGARLRTKHGHTARGAKTGEYNSWHTMIARCTNPKTPKFNRYGGRGIKVCVAWRASFERFLEDMGPRPSLAHKLDRIDNDGDYEPGNCRWATQRQQCRNFSRNHRIALNGETLTIVEWSERTGISQGTIAHRINSGWAPERALLTSHRSGACPHCGGSFQSVARHIVVAHREHRVVA